MLLLLLVAVVAVVVLLLLLLLLVVVVVVVVGASGAACLGGRRCALLPNPSPALRSLIRNYMTFFGFVFVIVSCCLSYCSSFLVAGGLLELVILFAMLFVIMGCFMYMIDYYLLEAVVSFCDHTKTAASFSEVLMCPFRL